MRKFYCSNQKTVMLYVVFAIMIISVISMKKNYHVDEIFTYGLANNQDGAVMHPKSAPYTYMPAADAYREYMVVDVNESFDLSHVWENQKNDVHPPAYYVIVYVLSYLYKGRFTKWIAGVINIVFALVCLWAMRKILDILECSEQEKTAISLFFIFSADILASTAFLRMYILLMAEVTYLTYLVLKYRDKPFYSFYMRLCIISVLGSLTHHYFLLYLFSLSIVYCFYQLLNKCIKLFLSYVFSMLVSGGLSYLIFPATIKHLFTMERSRNAFKSIGGGIELYWYKIKSFFIIISNSLFKGILLFLLIMTIFVIFIFTRERFAKIGLTKSNLIKNKDKIWKIVFLTAPCMGYFLLVAGFTQKNEIWDRYMSPIYGVLIVAVLHIVKSMLDIWFGHKKNMGFLVYIILLSWVTAESLSQYKWSILYSDSKEIVDDMVSYGLVDGLYVYSGEDYRIQSNFLQVSQLNSVTFFEKDMSALSTMEELKQKPKFVLFTLGVDTGKVIGQIMEECPQITSYEKIKSFGEEQVYWMYGGEKD